MEEGKKVIVTQTRSESGRKEDQKRTLKALGLGKIGKTREFTVNPALWGMLRKVRHVIRVTEA